LVLPPDDTKAPFSGLVLPIPLSERDHPEDRETPLRYAVVSALGRANLIPREREHLRRARVVLQDVASFSGRCFPLGGVGSLERRTFLARFQPSG